MYYNRTTYTKNGTWFGNNGKHLQAIFVYFDFHYYYFLFKCKHFFCNFKHRPVHSQNKLRKYQKREQHIENISSNDIMVRLFTVKVDSDKS